MTRTGIAKHLSWVFGLGVLLASAPGSAADQLLTFMGLGPVRIGMTLAQAERALGAKLKSIYPDMPEACWFGNRADGVDGPISYWIENDKVVRIDINDSAWPSAERVVPPVATERGIRIDSVTDDVKKAYGPSLIVKFHPQGNEGDESALYLRVPSDDHQYGLLFEIWDGKVNTFRAGTAEAFYIDEPCN